ncbi:hypothetical protein SAMN04490244_103133 [Tranquillimonas rosea]|uniref:Succinate dehydrogenase n=1 Tax=Tranquillimonas rosea TaxID=641238 RepID=A0A1H9SC19_9RHOB|nr:hypothetical protein [Tranquillimonas rosea]SER82554.1 hypothetical protein SAMN04490244_103133 [Tranquillimonas rosea]
MLIALGLAACTPASRDDFTRAAARSAVRPVIAERFPGVPLQPAVDCVINGATTNEILGLASDSVTGPTAATVETVTRVAQRPQTLSCLASDGVPALLQ